MSSSQPFQTIAAWVFLPAMHALGRGQANAAAVPVAELGSHARFTRSFLRSVFFGQLQSMGHIFPCEGSAETLLSNIRQYGLLCLAAASRCPLEVGF
jgi:hypothetical protein